jgi:PncC family amidohydrolase
MDTESLARHVGEQLLVRHLTLGLAESCTGGLLASYITDIAGSSAYFLGGVVAYSNEIKRRLLGVRASTLREFGAVSSETVLEMALGARTRLKVDIAVAVTGIAGPGGALPDKPVGMTYIGLASSTQGISRRYVWAGARRENRECSARAALELILEYLESLNGES